MLIQQFDLLDKQIEIAEQRVAEVLDSELARRLQTIPGVGPALAATFIAEIGDIWRFEDFDQLASYAGIHPKEQSSATKGQNPETSWHMPKTGNSYLRSAAYKMAVVETQHNPVIRAHYLRKRAQGKSAMNALGHSMSKALAIVWGVWRSGRDFDPPSEAPGLDKTLWVLDLGSGKVDEWYHWPQLNSVYIVGFDSAGAPIVESESDTVTMWLVPGRATAETICEGARVARPEPLTAIDSHGVWFSAFGSEPTYAAPIWLYWEGTGTKIVASKPPHQLSVASDSSCLCRAQFDADLGGGRLDAKKA